MSVALYHQDTRERFDQDTRTWPFFNDGHAVTSAFYVTAALGRWREADEELVRDYGDERFFCVQAGGTLGRFGARLQVEGLDGLVPEIEGVTLPSARRELLELTPVVSVSLGPGSVEAGLQIPLHGRNLPAGETVLVGYFADFRLF